MSRPGVKFDTSKPYPNSPMELFVAPSVEIKGLRCSFCGVDVPRVRATIGKAVRGWITPVNDDALTLTQNIRIQADDVVACPDHSLRIAKPKFVSLEDQ